MARISMVEYESASQEVKKQFDYQIKQNGKITNMKKTLLHSLPAFHALMEWYSLRDEAEKFIGTRGVNFYCYAISTQNDCLICSTFFGKILKDLHIAFETFEFTPMEKVLIDYGRALVSNPHHIDDQIFETLKHFFNEEQIIILTAFGGLMIATNLINTALEVKLDDYLLGYTGGKA